MEKRDQLKTPFMAQVDEDSDEENRKFKNDSSYIDSHKVSLNRESEYSQSDLDSKEGDDEIKSEKSENKQKSDNSLSNNINSWRNIGIGEKFENNANEFLDNTIHTSKYTLINFLPKNLFVQFSKMANVYFLVMTIFQVIPAISITSGQPTILVPLGFVIFVSMVKGKIKCEVKFIWK